MRVAERIDAQDDEDTAERELAAWRLEIRLHALAQLARKPAKPPLWVRISAFVALLLLLTMSLVGLRHAMRPKISPNEMAIQIRLIDELQPAPAPGRSLHYPGGHGLAGSRWPQQMPPTIRSECEPLVHCRGHNFNDI